MRGMFWRTVARLIQTGPGRWLVSGVFVIGGLFFAALSLFAQGNNRWSLLIGGILFFAVGLYVLYHSVRIARLLKRSKDVGEARAKELLASGKLLPIPPLPPAPKGASKEDLTSVENYALQLESIPWGDNPQVPTPEVRHVFDRNVAVTRRITGDWSKLHQPIQTFSILPRPYAAIGAAEVMFRLSYLRDNLYAPIGLRQGLRFTTRAQIHTPLQPDALIIQFKLLAACTSPYWQQLATRTLDLLRQVAPDHPRLPNAEMFYNEMRGAYDEALACADRAIACGPTAEEAYAALSRKALILLNQKRSDEALIAFDARLAQDPNDPWAWHNKSLLLTRVERYQEALACNERALSIMPFGVAEQQRRIILAKLGAGGAKGV